MFRVEIKTGNAAYRDENENLDYYEVVRNLKEICKKLENGYTDGYIMDINGNKTGKWSLED